MTTLALPALTAIVLIVVVRALDGAWGIVTAALATSSEDCAATAPEYAASLKSPIDLPPISRIFSSWSGAWLGSLEA